jgi:hypothetical protein
MLAATMAGAEERLQPGERLVVIPREIDLGRDGCERGIRAYHFIAVREESDQEYAARMDAYLEKQRASARWRGEAKAKTLAERIAAHEAALAKLKAQQHT